MLTLMFHIYMAIETAQPLVAQDNIDRNMKEKLTKEHMLQTLQSTFAPTNKFNSNQIYMILQESLKQNMTESRSVPETTTTGRKSTRLLFLIMQIQKYLSSCQ